MGNLRDLAASSAPSPFLRPYQFETRILERGADGWKIVYLNFSTPSETSDPSSRIEVDAEARSSRCRTTSAKGSEPTRD